MSKRRLYRIALCSTVVMSALMISTWAFWCPTVFAASDVAPPTATGSSGQSGSDVHGTVTDPGTTSTPAPPTVLPSPSPTNAPSPSQNGSSGTPPPQSTSTTAAQGCAASSQTPTTNPLFGFTPAGSSTTALLCGVASAPALNNPAPRSALTMATSPPPNLAPYVAQAFEQIVTNPGTIKAAPPNHTGLVNLPQCYWLTGQSVTGKQTVSMDLKGAPNASGQQITYHIALTVTLNNIIWNFGDGSEQTTTVPIPCIGDSGGASSLVAHNYVTYSQDQPNSSFLVTASETYQASAVMTWVDDNGPESENVTLNGNTTTVATPPYPVRIDQEESVGS